MAKKRRVSTTIGVGIAVLAGAWLLYPKPDPPVVPSNDPRINSLKPRWNRLRRRWEVDSTVGWVTLEELGRTPLGMV